MAGENTICTNSEVKGKIKAFQELREVTIPRAYKKGSKGNSSS